MYVVDRIDVINGIMVCEDLESKSFEQLPLIKNVKEGDYIKKVDNEYIIDLELTNNKKDDVRSKLEYLKNKSKHN